MTTEQECQPALATWAPSAQQTEAGDSARCCAGDGAEFPPDNGDWGDWEMADV